MEDAGDARGNVLVVARAETAEDLTALSMRDLLARKAACDAIITQKGERFFEALNRWLSTTVPALAGSNNILSVEGWDNFSSGDRVMMRYRCRLNLVRGYLTAAFFNALGRLGLVSVVPDFARQEISLAFSADSLDVSDMGILVERAEAAVRAERLAAEEARGQRPGTGGTGAAVETTAAEVGGAAAAAVEHGPEDSGEESG